MRPTLRSRTTAVPALALLAALLTACGRGLSRIDAHTQRELQRTTADLDGGAITPERSYPPVPPRTPGQKNTNPPSVNPPAEALAYTPADEARDVGRRLETFTGEIGTYGEDDQRTPPEGARVIDLREALRASQLTGREFLNAEEDYILASIRLLIERHLWSPRFFNDTTASLAGAGDNGDFSSALRVINELGVTQRLPYGGTVSASWLYTATEQLREVASDRYRQASELSLDVTVPLLRGAGLVARESLIQAERDLIYAAREFEDFRRSYLVEIAADYFDLLQSNAELANQRRALASAQRLEDRAKALAAAGREPQFEVNNAQNRRLRAEADLASSRERYVLALDRFKIRLGLPVTDVVWIEPLLLSIPDPDVSLEEAAAKALEYRLDLQTRRDQLDDSRRAVRNARNELLPDLEFRAGVGAPTPPGDDTGGILVDPDFLDYATSITFGLPLDRYNERLRLRQAVIGLQQDERSLDQFRDNVVLTARDSVRSIELARFRLTLAEQQVTLNELRQREIELKADEVTTQQKLDALNDLLDAENSRDQARTDLRNAILAYLRDTGQLRVARDGTFQPLPGMN